MKVLVVTNMYPGKEQLSYGIFVKEQVESLRKEGILVDVVFINGKKNRLNYFTSIISLSRKSRSYHYDIIHAHHTYCVYPLLPMRMLIKTKLLLVLTFHEGEVHKPRELVPMDADAIKKLVYLKWLKKMALKNVDLVITVEKKLIEKLGFRGKVVVLPCGVDLDLFQPRDKAWCRAKLAFPVNKKIIFFPALPERKTSKGFDVLEEALKFISRKDISLVTGGDIPHDDMPYYMCVADVVVQTSNFEASPMVIKEAMACNIPIVSTNVGDVERIIGDTKGCYICERNVRDVAEKIEKALEFNAETEGRDRILALGLGLHQVSRKIIQIYKDLVKLHRERRTIEKSMYS